MAMEESCSIVSNLQLCHSKQRKRLCHHTLSLFPMMKEDIISRFPDDDDDDDDDDDVLCLTLSLFPKNGEDIISRFSDDVLCHILSFLPMEDVVRTSLLSKRWSSVWTSVRSIDISDNRRFERQLRMPNFKGGFMDFVDRVLRFNDAFFLRKFRLHCYLEYDDSRIGEWIKSMTTHIVEDLNLDFFANKDIRLPPSFFTCNKLVVLKLGNGFHLDVPAPACLPSLKILHLDGLSIFNDVTMKNLLDGCPVLEELHIKWCSYVKMKTLFVQSSSLKSLRVSNHNTYRNEIGIIVDAKNLELLNLESDMTEQCDMTSLCSLIEVNLNIYHWTRGKRVDGNKIVELQRSMSHTKCMHLSHHTMKFLEDARLDNLPMFHKLTCLELQINEKGWQVLPYLLKCSPNLLTFVLSFLSEKDQREWHQQFHKPKCLMLYLQEIKLTGFRGCTHGMELISYFLKNATILKKMRILFSNSYYKDRILKKLLMFPKSSSACQISFD